MPVTINVIVGEKRQILIQRRNFRLFRKWQEKRYSKWAGKKMNKKKILSVQRWAFFIPGEYLFIRDARKFIDACKGTVYEIDYLFDE